MLDLLILVCAARVGKRKGPEEINGGRGGYSREFREGRNHICRLMRICRVGSLGARREREHNPTERESHFRMKSAKNSFVKEIKNEAMQDTGVLNCFPEE